MKQGQPRLHLSPLHGGSFTRLRLSCSVVTALPPTELQRLLVMLSLWSGWPVRLVLSVDGAAGGWFDFWTDALEGVPEHHLELVFDVREVAGHDR